MKWRPVQEAELKRNECFRMERLHTPRGDLVGTVMQFNAGGPAHALSDSFGIGLFDSFEEARAEVERKQGRVK